MGYLALKLCPSVVQVKIFALLLHHSPTPSECAYVLQSYCITVCLHCPLSFKACAMVTGSMVSTLPTFHKRYMLVPMCGSLLSYPCKCSSFVACEVYFQ